MSRAGYAGFGSFHSGDVEVLVRQDAAAYQPPQLPFPDPACEQRFQLGAGADGTASTSAGAEGASAGQPPAAAGHSSRFGAPARSQFLIDFSTWTFLNAGAFGGPSRAAQEAGERWRRHAEAQPLDFIDRQLFPQLVRVIRELAAFVNCRPQDLVLLPNATTGLNAVITSVAKQLQPGDAVFSLDIGYGSVKKMLRAACDASGAEMVTADVTFPISGPEDIVSLVQDQLPGNARLAVFDAVTSNTALVLPLPALVQLCRDRGVPVLIDGAHALGHLPVDLQQLQPDFFVSNCHKFLAGARGSAMLYVSPRWQEVVQPPVLSHGAEAGFLSRFIWDGCRDYAPLLAIGTAVQWWRLDGSSNGSSSCSTDHPAQQQQPAHAGDGGCAARAYMHQLCRSAADMLCARWGTACLAPASMTAAMALVQLPSGGALPMPGQATSADAKHVQDLLHDRHRIEVPVKTVQGCLYVRISAAIYNCLADYERLAAAVEAIKVAQDA